MTWTWPALAALGAGHGLNPGMGWLFAVALGMQEGAGGARVAGAPAARAGARAGRGFRRVGGGGAGRVLPAEVLRWGCWPLLGLGALRLLRHRHPRYGGMRVGFRELTTWSFLMATAHGAGLMVLPLVVGAAGPAAHPHPHATQLMAASIVPGLPGSGPVALGLQATALHTAGYLLVTGLVALLVYRKLGLRMLRTMWINLDLIWGGALVVTGAVALLA